LLFALALTALAGAVPFLGADDAKTKEKIIPAAEIRSHVGKECTAEMTVKASKNAVPRRTYFLDSEEDFHDEKNLAVVISYDHAAKFLEAGIDDPAEYYKGKTIRVTGKVIEEDDQVRIRVDDPKQIKLVEPKSP
jgi:DNA/RNA endonuclease YhcR with UshA esterase domain